MQESLYSKSVKGGSKTYFFDVRQTKNADKYLTITESRIEGEGKRTRNTIAVFPDHMREFTSALQEASKKVNQI